MKSNTNYLLLKDDVGKPRPQTRDIPKGDFCFGKAVKKDSHNASSLLSDW